MKSLTWIYLITLFLLATQRESLEMHRDTKQKSLEGYFKSKKTRALANGYILGNKTLIKRQDKLPYKALNLQHLFTPSGIHLTSLYLVILPVINLIKRFSPFLGRIFHLLFLFFPYFLTGFYSLKRISLLRIFSLFFKRQTPFPNYLNLFFMTFLLDSLFGTFSSSPLSFTFSFLFIGVIFSMSHLPKAWLFFPLFGGQVLIAFSQGIPLYFLGSLQGFFLTALFSLLFPLLFFLIVIPSPLTHLVAEKIILFFDALVSKAYSLALVLPSFTPSFPILLMVLILTLKIRSKRKYLAVLIALSLHFSDLPNLPKSSFLKRRSQNDSLQKTEIKQIIRTQRGYRITLLDKTRCQATLYGSFHRVKCRKNLAKKPPVL